MKKIAVIIISVTVLFGVYCISNPVKAITATTTSSEITQKLLDQINQLKNQIAELQLKLEGVKQAEKEIKETVKEITATLKLTRQLRWGMSGEDVKLLQEILATAPEIYPEKLVTGYYGNLTEKAVKRLQKSLCFDQVGNVGPKTLSKINELLTEGAGKYGKVPPGLLTAPGIQKKFCLPITPATSTTPTTPEQGCLNSGGQVATSSCCLSASDFPNLCLIGACGCDATNSHDVNTCNCGDNKCFNGTECTEVE